MLTSLTHGYVFLVAVRIELTAESRQFLMHYFCYFGSASAVPETRNSRTETVSKRQHYLFPGLRRAQRPVGEIFDPSFEPLDVQAMGLSFLQRGDA